MTGRERLSEYKCPKCNSTNLFTRKNGDHTGLYCKDCGRWIKWLNKEEARLFEVDNEVSCANCVHRKVCKIKHFPSLFGLTGNGCEEFLKGE